MRASLPAVLLATAAVVLAGCIGSSAPSAPEDQPKPTVQQLPPVERASAPEPPQPTLAVYPYEGRLTFSAGAQGVGYLSPTGNSDTHVYSFAVTSAPLAIVAELRWADPVQDLDLELGTPDCDANVGKGVCAFADGGAPASGDSPVKLVFTNAEALQSVGDWKLYVWGKNAANLDFQGAVTVFYDAMPEDNYTALAP